MCAPLVHGETGDNATPEYRAWNEMKARCYRRSHVKFACYGGRGIAVCAEWRASYEAFLAAVGRRPAKGYSLGRIDNNGPYAPGNVRWETPIEQARNKRNNVLLTAFGRTLCLAAWSAETGLGETTIGARLRAGWAVERALSRPAQRRLRRAG